MTVTSRPLGGGSSSDSPGSPSSGGGRPGPDGPRWPAPVGIVLCLAGLAVSGYLTWAHYTTATNLSCPDSGLVNCVKVTTSSYSHFLGIPVAVLGLVFFAGMLMFNLPVAWRSTNRAVRTARVLGSAVGVVMVLYLLFAELQRINALCLYCTAVHILTFFLFVATALATVSTAAEPADAVAA